MGTQEFVLPKSGESSRSAVKAGEWADGSTVMLPVLAVRGKSDGPILWMNALVHGDEINGAVAALRAFQSIDPEQLRGAVVCTPVANPLAYNARQRLSLTDSLDLDQQFPGSATGFTTQRIAHRLFSMIKRTATHLISFHSNGISFVPRTYTVFKRVPEADPSVLEQTARLALAFGTHFNCMVDVAEATGELPGTLSGTIDMTCILNGIPAFMAEVGGGGRVEEQSTAEGVRGAHGVMRALGMLPDGEGVILDRGGSPLPDTHAEEQLVITKRRFLVVDRGGICQMLVKPGDIITEGQPVATVANWFGDSVTIMAPNAMCIIMVRAYPAVHEGDRIAFVGLEWVTADKFVGKPSSAQRA